MIYSTRLVNYFFSLLIVCCLPFRPLKAQTQIQNAGFENWKLINENTGRYAPENWSEGWNCDENTCQSSIARVTDSQEGDYALAHFTNDYDFGDGDRVQYIPYVSYSNLPGNFEDVPFSGKPTSVSFYYKYTTDNDQNIDVIFQTYNGHVIDNSTDPIAYALFSTTEKQLTYKKVEIDFSNFGAETDASSIVILFSFGSEQNPPANGFDTLRIDNIVFNYSATAITDHHSTDELKVYVYDKSLKSSQPIQQVQVTDLSGKLIMNFMEEGTDFNLTQIKSGLFLVHGVYQDKPFSRRVIIE